MSIVAPGFIRGNSYEIDVTDTSGNVSVDAAASLQTQQYIFSNEGANTAFVTFTIPAALGGATPVAVAPASGAPANGFPILAGSVQCFSLCAGARIAAICKTGLTTTLYITPVEGM